MSRAFLAKISAGANLSFLGTPAARMRINRITSEFVRGTVNANKHIRGKNLLTCVESIPIPSGFRNALTRFLYQSVLVLFEFFLSALLLMLSVLGLLAVLMVLSERFAIIDACMLILFSLMFITGLLSMFISIRKILFLAGD